jgi:DNA invertase Pin-like site-specific DNA recombinase
MPFYAIYTRQSRVRHDVTLSSCDVQFRICRDFAEAVLPQGSVWCGTRYDDPGQSGESTDRPAIKALLAEIEEDTLSFLIVYRLDRLSRRLIDTVQILETLRRHDVELKIVTAPHLSDSTTSQLMLNLLASFAEFERGLISERIRDSFRGNRRSGRRLTGKPPFGYDLWEHSKDLVVNRGEARKVREFFRLAAAGQTPRQLAEHASARGWTTKTYVTRSGRRMGGHPWASRQVLDLLRNPVYAGCLRDRDGRRSGRHRAIVRTALFDTVQGLLDARRPSASDRRRRCDLPFRGRIFCAQCGRPMSPHTILKPGQPHIRYWHYRCRSHAGGRPPCKGVCVSAGELDRFVRDTLRDRRELDADPNLTPESRDALEAVGWLLDGLRVPDPCLALGDIVERIIFSRDSIRVEFSEPVISELRATYGRSRTVQEDENPGSRRGGSRAR